MEMLPEEMWQEIFSKLDFHDQLSCTQVNSVFRNAAKAHFAVSHSLEVRILPGNEYSWIIPLSNHVLAAKNRLEKLQISAPIFLPIEVRTFSQIAAKFGAVTDLRLIRVKISNQLLMLIPQFLPKLKSFSLEYFTSCHKWLFEHPPEPDLDKGLSMIINRCKGLRKLHLWIDRIPLPKYLEGLEALQLESLTFRTGLYRTEWFDEIFRLISLSCANLTSLELVMCFDHKVTDWYEPEDLPDHLRKIGRNSTKIRHVRLDFSEFYRLTEQFPLWRFGGALRFFPETLESVDLRGCQGIETFDIRSISEYCLNLRHLNLSDTKIGHSQSLEPLQLCPNLQGLNISRIQFYDRASLSYKRLNDTGLYSALIIPNLNELIANGELEVSQNFFIREFIPFVANNISLSRVSFVDCPGTLTAEFLPKLYKALSSDDGDFHGTFEISLSPAFFDDFATLGHGISDNPLRGLWYKKYESCDDAVFVIARSAF